MRAAENLAAKLERSLVAYAAAAGAAGVGIIAMARSADAKVIYTPAYEQISLGEHYDLDLNGDRVTDFTILGYSGGFPSDFEYELDAQPVRGNALEGHSSHPGGIELASALVRGSSISSQKTFESRFAAVMGGFFYFLGSTFTKGQWVNVKHKYLGLKFVIDGQTHFGWARLNVKVDISRRPVQITGTLTGYAYETIPNKPIVAGNRGSTTGQGPEAEPVSLGHLALGAAGERVHAMKTK